MGQAVLCALTETLVHCSGNNHAAGERADRAALVGGKGEETPDTGDCREIAGVGRKGEDT